MLLVASDRISAFDHVLPKAIPFKGQVLNQIAAFFLEKTKDIVPNWWISSPDPNVSYGWYGKPYKVEMVIRGYLAGHAWRLYQSGKRSICGIQLPDGLREADPLPEPIITPSTKAEEGHDEDISREEILRQGIVPEPAYLQMEDYTRKLFASGSEMARDRGLILVDTKYEFGEVKGEVCLIDEVHTPDSSRYYISEGYDDRQSAGTRQVQLSKEFVREWLIANGFQGREGERIPAMTEDFVDHVSRRYIDLYEKLTGLRFEADPSTNIAERIEKNVLAQLQND